MGSFPCQSEAKISREKMLQRCQQQRRSSVQEEGLETQNKNNQECFINHGLALSDLDDERLFIPTARSETSFATPKPKDELDWLAQVPEEGQTYEDYISFLVSRRGRMKPIANAEGLDILLLPIIRSEAEPLKRKGNYSHHLQDWEGPSMEHLVQYTQVFFDRQVRVLPAAQLSVSQPEDVTSSAKKRKTQLRESNKPGAFASKSKFKLYLPQRDGALTAPVPIAGREDPTSDRIQLKVDSLLDELSSYRLSGKHDSHNNNNTKEFCIMAITMIDLFDGPSDLFCAGMAFGGDKVAVFSFKRYHPLIKMHPLYWHNYGYAKTFDGYSYYEDDDQDPKGLSSHPSKISKELAIEFLRRSSKLLTHELGHLYGFDHCIHNRCLMMGTGHLVEDFRAPSNLCGICLRKLQFRTGCDIVERYKKLSDAFRKMGFVKEEVWTLKQHKHLKRYGH